MRKTEEISLSLHTKHVTKTVLSNRISYKRAFIGDTCAAYHYTSPEGLMGILKNREIFFTDAEFLNDASERKNINEDLNRFWARCKKDYEERFIRVLSDIRVNAYEDYRFGTIDKDYKGKACRYFVLSASKDSDSLSMWKYYAKNGSYNGYNIGLDTLALQDTWINREQGIAIEYGSVIYEDDEKYYQIKEAVNHIYESWIQYEYSDKLDEKIRGEFETWVSLNSLFFKHKSFSTEEEYRYVAVVPTENIKILSYTTENGSNVQMYNFRAVDGVLTPYIKVPIWGTDDLDLKATFWNVASIGIAPCLNFELKKNGVIQFVKSLPYRVENFQINKSKIPVRY